MNALFLLVALVIAFVFGYRFYAKLLALDAFRLDKNYSTPAQSRADARDYVPTHPHVLFGHHLAALGGAAMFAAPIAATAWGWVPAFLWIVVGSAVAGGTYGLGSYWLALRRPTGIRQLAGESSGPYTRLILFLYAVIALIILIAASAGFVSTIVAAYPGSVLPLLAITLAALMLGSYLHGRTESQLLPASAIAFVATLLLVWLLSGIPIAFNGALVVAIGDDAWLSIEAVLVWVVLFLVYTFHAARLPIWKLTRPRAFLTSLLLVVLLIVFYLALAIDHPTILAPQFHTPAATASALPWLFLIVGPGALAGWQWLVIHHVTAREMRRETDARYIGYGGALAQGLVALTAILIATTAPDATEWSKLYANAPQATDLPRFLVFYIEGFARYASILGFDPSFARNFAATIMAGLTLAVLENAARALKHLLAEVSPPAPATRPSGAERARLWLIVLAAGLLALHDGRGLGALMAWPILALISLWLAAAGFALMAIALRRGAHPAAVVETLAAALALIAAWASVTQLWQWWEAGAWVEFAAGFAVLLLACIVLRELLRAHRHGVADERA